MIQKKNFDLSVYFVADPSCCAGRSVVDVVKEAVNGGVTIVQYRNKSGSQQERMKEAGDLAHFLKPLKVPFIMNDDVLLAQHVGAGGVHLGQGDMPSEEARKILGPDKIIGVTAFTPNQIKSIDPSIVDYIGTGPVYETKTDKGKPVLKPEKFAELVKISPVPVVGIGGVTPDNARSIINAGASGVAMMRSISESDNPRGVAAAFAMIFIDENNDKKHSQYSRI